MPTQSGITISAPNAPYTVVNDIEQPTPGPKQALVKTLYVGLNPVEPFMQHSGILISSWPAVIGSDVSGVVVSTGPDCKKVKKGDYIYGCVPVGLNEFSPFQETFLIGEDWMFKKGENIGLEEGCTIGAAVLTAALALMDGQDLALPAPGEKVELKNEWVVVMGGSGSVGQYVVQLANLCGYKVLASCSPSKSKLTLDAGASATFSHHATVDEQLAEIEKITEGRFGRVVDASAQAVEVPIKALVGASKVEAKYFATVDDWSEINAPDSIKLYRIQFAKLGRDDELGKHVANKFAEWIPVLEGHLQSGALKPLDYHLVEGQGWEKVIEGIADMEAGKLARKPVVKVQQE